MTTPRKPVSSQRRSRTFREPAALKRVNKSLDSAYHALAELRKDAGRDISQGARDVYQDVRTLVADARRDTGKLARALARDFEQAERDVTVDRGRSRPRAGASGRRAPQATAKQGRKPA
jgi:hypothetical protein